MERMDIWEPAIEAVRRGEASIVAPLTDAEITKLRELLADQESPSDPPSS